MEAIVYSRKNSSPIMDNCKLVIASFFTNFPHLFCANKKATLKEGEVDDGINLDDEVSSVVVVS